MLFIVLVGCKEEHENPILAIVLNNKDLFNLIIFIRLKIPNTYLLIRGSYKKINKSTSQTE